MERVRTTLSLSSAGERVGMKPIPLGQAIGICLLLIILTRMAFIGITALLDIVPALAFVNAPLKQINSLTYLVAVPVGIGIYAWARASKKEQLLETITNLFHKRAGVLGIVIVSSLIVVGDFAPRIASYDPIQSMIGQPGEKGKLPGKAPCIGLLGCTESQHILGLDLNARDLFSRIIYGARTSIPVAIASVTFGLVSGTLFGLTAGYAEGWVDNVIMRLMDVLLAFPPLLLAITIVTIQGPGLANALLAIAIVSIPVYARLTRASV